MEQKEYIEYLYRIDIIDRIVRINIKNKQNIWNT